MLDANHPLAGKAVKAWARVLEVRPATEHEIAHATGTCDGHHD